MSTERKPGTFVPGDPRAGRRKGSLNKTTQEIRDLAQRLLSDRIYRANLRQRLRDGTAGQIEVLLFYYAYGKPVERVHLAGEAAEVAIQLEWEDGRSVRERLAAKLDAMARRLDANVPPEANGHGL
jgi:hypothetical protein